jgi:poly(A) polymerase
MVEPIVLPRSEHTLSSRDVDADALKVMGRLQELGHTAFLVGGSVRDLLLGRRPKDFDIGTSAQPHQIKRAFRNCWIIGRRFRLAHVKFGPKTIEVATFRRNVRADAEDAGPENGNGNGAGELLVQRDNAYGTPEEDAFRRDFTVNGLFYDSSDRSIIDYVGGLQDLETRIVRSIGDPVERFQEDPVRMLRAVVLAARLDFAIDPDAVDAIRRHASLIAKASQARLLEEFYKILRSGASERAFRQLAEVGLLEHLAPELMKAHGQALWPWLASLDTYRHRFEAIPDSMSNPILLGTLLVPHGFNAGRKPRRFEDGTEPEREPPALLGRMQLPRRDIERLRQILGLQRRLLDLEASPRARRALIHRGPFNESLTWLDIHGRAPEVLEHW